MHKIRTYLPTLLALVAVVAATAGIEIWTGRSLLGPDGQFGWWESSIWSQFNSQRVADAYTFSHIAHGLIFYWFLWLVARKLSVRARLVWAAIMEAAWEILENSPIIINRYREATIAQGYVGDSVLNSSADVVFACLGFLFAWRFGWKIGLALILAMEIGTLVWVRDNLTLNVVMLVWPIDAIREWQAAGAPGSI
jgi:hypothetical protein